MSELKLPKGWMIARVGDILTIRNGFAFKSTDYCESGTPVVRQADLCKSTIDLSNARYVPDEFLQVYPQFKVNKGDILIGLSGSLGKVSRYEYERPALQNQRVGLLLITDLIDCQFAMLLMRFLTPSIIDDGKGVAVQNVSTKDIENKTAPLPPIREQRRIAYYFDELETSLDAGVAALERVQANLKRYRAAVLKSAVEGKLTAQWRKKNKPAETGEQLLARILKERRKKWEDDQLAKFAAAGKSPPKGWQAKYAEPVNRAGLYELPTTWTWGSTLAICERVENGSTPPPRPIASNRHRSIAWRLLESRGLKDCP